MLTKRHYKAIAEVIRRLHAPELGPPGADPYVLLEALADYFGSDNPNFDRDKFIDACYGR